MIGFLLVDKAPEWTSHDVVAKVRKLTGIKKVGHAGTLDPMATGLVILGVGRATKLLRFIQDLPKVYVARIKFGIATDSLDADGEVVSDQLMPFLREDLEGVLGDFIGEILQVPPMVSALKVDGRRLYELAREGIEVERKPRPIFVEAIELLEFAGGSQPEAIIRVKCGKGTYIRVLADDIAQKLGGRAHLTELRRISNGDLSVDSDAITLAGLTEAGPDWQELLVAPAEVLAHFPAVMCDAELGRMVSNGRRLPVGDLGLVKPDEGDLLAMMDGGQLVAVYRVAGNLAVPEVVLS